MIFAFPVTDDVLPPNLRDITAYYYSILRIINAKDLKALNVQ